MTAAPDASVGLRAAERLVRLGTTEIQPGLSETELARVEQRFGFEFADDHRAFLTAGLPAPPTDSRQARSLATTRTPANARISRCAVDG
ncbi:hypothetical protein AB0H36_36495 [Kribbella sp. NPDC050820]|uniref:hypothetical protein n=1 Tax=Kribbella sp. NPDC050820 TaxID=3155408 RepID=UPI0033CEF1E3